MTTLPSCSVAACVVIACLVLRAVLAVLKFRRYELAIPGPPSLPILGNALSVAFVTHEDIMERISTLRGHHRDMSRASLLHNLFVIVSKPEDVATVMKRKDLMDKPYFYYHVFAEMFPSGLVAINGPKWKMHRIASIPAFHTEIIERFVDMFAKEAEKFNASVEPYKEFLIEEKLLSTITRSFCRSVMMQNTPTKEQEEFVNSMVHFLPFWTAKFNERAFNPLLWSKWIYSKTKEGRLVKTKSQKIRQFLQQVVEARWSELKKRNDLGDADISEGRPTLLDVLLQAHSKDMQAFPIEDILDELLLYVVAATDTTVSALNFTFKMLALRPDIQQKVYEEVRNLLGSGEMKRSIVPQDLPKLEYTERFIKEVMRMFTTAPFIARYAKEDTELCGHQLPKGTTIIIHLFGLHRDPVTWPDPLRFDPDRFLPEQSQGRHPYAYLPFSSGPRSCIGHKFAWAEMKSLVATTIRDFVVVPANDGLTDYTQFKFSFAFSIELNGGVRVKLIPRTENSA